MKTPEKIKKGLEYCNRRTPLVYEKCDGCPYHGEEECMRKMELDALAYIRQLEAKVPQWISVKERLPEDGERVLVHTRQGAYRIGTFSYVGKEGAVWFRCDRSCITCTHWMPLPEPPRA